MVQTIIIIGILLLSAVFSTPRVFPAQDLPNGSVIATFVYELLNCRRQVGELNFRRIAQNDGVLDRVGEFANIARPIVSVKGREHFLRKTNVAPMPEFF